MPNYRFKVLRTGSEKTGAAVLADDEEALAFGQRVIRKLIQGEASKATGSMEITTGNRNVAHIPFESGTQGAPTLV
jgi:hypothetical protein